MENALTLQVAAKPADVFATLFALSFVTLLTALALVATGHATAFVAPPALAAYAALTVASTAALWTTAA